MDSQQIENQIAIDFENKYRGKMDDNEIKETTSKILKSKNSYSATGSIAGGIVYVDVSVSLKDTKGEFKGHDWGPFSPGAGALFGDVYTDDLDALLKDTITNEVNAIAVYTSILFFGPNRKFLGHFQSGGVSTILGFGSGSGKWN